MEFYVARVVVCTTRAQPKDRPPARGSSINTHIHACCCPFITHSMARPRAGVCTVHHTHPTITHTSYTYMCFMKAGMETGMGRPRKLFTSTIFFPRRERERQRFISLAQASTVCARSALSPWYHHSDILEPTLSLPCQTALPREDMGKFMLVRPRPTCHAK